MPPAGGSGGSAVGLLSNARQYLWIPITQNAYRRISLDLFSHMLDLDLHFHLHRKTGEVMRCGKPNTGSAPQPHADCSKHKQCAAAAVPCRILIWPSCAGFWIAAQLPFRTSWALSFFRSFPKWWTSAWLASTSHTSWRPG